MPNLLAIETTVIGREYDAAEVAPIDILDAVESKLKLDPQLEADWRSFEVACAVGCVEIEAANADRSLRIVPLALLRSCGLRAIPSLASEIGALPQARPLAEVVEERRAADAVEDLAEASAGR